MDGILDPADTREVVAACIAACAHQGEIPRARWGVLQTWAAGNSFLPPVRAAVEEAGGGAAPLQVLAWGRYGCRANSDAP